MATIPYQYVEPQSGLNKINPGDWAPVPEGSISGLDPNEQTLILARSRNKREDSNDPTEVGLRLQGHPETEWLSKIPQPTNSQTWHAALIEAIGSAVREYSNVTSMSNRLIGVQLTPHFVQGQDFVQVEDAAPTVLTQSWSGPSVALGAGTWALWPTFQWITDPLATGNADTKAEMRLMHNGVNVWQCSVMGEGTAHKRVNGGMWIVDGGGDVSIETRATQDNVHDRLHLRLVALRLDAFAAFAWDANDTEVQLGTVQWGDVLNSITLDLPGGGDVLAFSGVISHGGDTATQGWGRQKIATVGIPGNFCGQPEDDAAPFAVDEQTGIGMFGVQTLPAGVYTIQLQAYRQSNQSAHRARQYCVGAVLLEAGGPPPPPPPPPPVTTWTLRHDGADGSAALPPDPRPDSGNLDLLNDGTAPPVIDVETV